MEFRFENQVTPWDIWRLSMYHIYHSMIGVCNIIFAVAIVLLTIHLWDPRQEVLMSILILLCVLFPLMQPIVIYVRAAKQVAVLPKDMIIEINETGVHITGNGQKSHIPWNHIRGIITESNMLIFAADAGRGYMLTNKMLDTQKDALLEYAESKLKKKA